ncbi:DUF3429 domain-containing protein [Neoroseomonas rubea]|uniref:DUF3429 domain-containing protein n=1 Tax=Neoroseomonas rubea TaxID=2748666 RepID=UPI0018E04B9A|nr:DUF3429 domain-containing protein [Roseomonas rubea]
MSESTVPRAALWLGMSGLLPTLAMLAAMLAWPEAREIAARGGIAYGAVIASFVGGAWWGLAASRAAPEDLRRRLVISVVPSLVAWPAVLAPPVAGLGLLALLFAVLLPTDRRFLAEGLAPAWWLGLRRPLSFGMAGLHAAAAVVLAFGAPR